jgi:hypothetical protein
MDDDDCSRGFTLDCIENRLEAYLPNYGISGTYDRDEWHDSLIEAAEKAASHASMFRHLRDNQAIVGKTEDGKWQVIYQGEVLHLGPESDSFEGAVRMDMDLG